MAEGEDNGLSSGGLSTGGLSTGGVRAGGFKVPALQDSPNPSPEEMQVASELSKAIIQSPDLFANLLQTDPTLERDFSDRRNRFLRDEDPVIEVVGHQDPEYLPLEVKFAGSSTISVEYGLVNNVVPTIGSSPLTKTFPFPTISIGQTTNVWLKVVGTFGSPDTYVAEITITSGNDAISATEFTSYYPLASVDYTGGTPASINITPIHSGGNLIVRSMGNSIFWGKL